MAFQHRFTRVRLSTVAIGALVLLVAACGSGGAGEAGGDGQSKVNMLSASGTTPFLSLITEFTVTEDGIDEDNGYDGTIKQAASSQSTAALVSGDEHFALSNFGATATAVAKGIPLKIIGGILLRLPSAIVATDDIQSVADLKGAKVAVSALGNSSHIGVTSYVEQDGAIDPDDIEFVASGGTSKSVQYLVGGRVDAAWMLYDSAVTAVERSGLHILVGPEEMAKVATVGGVIVTTQEYAEGKPEIATKVMKSFIDANRRLYESEEAFVDAAEQFLPKDAYTRDQLATIYKVMRPQYTVNGGLDSALFESSYDVWAKYIDPESAGVADFSSGAELVDPYFVKEAIDELGYYEGAEDSADMAGH